MILDTAGMQVEETEWNPAGPGHHLCRHVAQLLIVLLPLPPVIR